MPHVAGGSGDDDGSGGRVAREAEEEEEEEEGAAPVLLQALARQSVHDAAPPADAYEEDEEDGGLDGQQLQLRRAVSGAHFAYGGGGDEEEDEEEDGDKKRSGGAFGLGRKPERPVDVGCFVFPLGAPLPEVRGGLPKPALRGAPEGTAAAVRLSRTQRRIQKHAQAALRRARHASAELLPPCAHVRTAHALPRAQGASPEAAVGAALDVLAALRAGGARAGDDDEAALAAGTDHLDVTAEHAWAVNCACAETGLDDAAALLERFRGVLLSEFGGGAKAAARHFGWSAISLLGTVSRPLQVHLVAGSGPAYFSMAPDRVLVVHSVEEAEHLLCALLLSGGRAACCATGAPALALALRDKLVQDGHVGTARPVLTNAPGLTAANPATFTSASFALRGVEAALMPRRAMWAEFLQHTMDAYGAQALVAFARGDVAAAPSGGAPHSTAAMAAMAAALDAAAAAAFPKVKSLTHMMQGARAPRPGTQAAAACMLPHITCALLTPQVSAHLTHAPRRRRLGARHVGAGGARHAQRVGGRRGLSHGR
jgi:hypothetical protein